MFRGIASYAKNRVGSQTAFNALHKNVRESAKQARSTLTPRAASHDEIVSSFRGRHSDGGKAAFKARMTDMGLSEADLNTMAMGRRTSAFILQAAGLLFLTIAIHGFTISDTPLALGSTISVLGAAMLLQLIGGKLHFEAWQIRERRFGGLREFLRA